MFEIVRPLLTAAVCLIGIFAQAELMNDDVGHKFFEMSEGRSVVRQFRFLEPDQTHFHWRVVGYVTVQTQDNTGMVRFVANLDRTNGLMGGQDYQLAGEGSIQVDYSDGRTCHFPIQVGYNRTQPRSDNTVVFAAMTPRKIPIELAEDHDCSFGSSTDKATEFSQAQYKLP